MGGFETEETTAGEDFSMVNSQLSNQPRITLNPPEKPKIPWTYSLPRCAECMDYLPALGEKLLHSRGNVGKYYLHGASGR